MTGCCGLQLEKLSEKEIIEMTFFPVVNEACRVFAEGIAVKAADLDIAGIFGMGFPPYRSVLSSNKNLFVKFSFCSLWI